MYLLKAIVQAKNDDINYGNLYKAIRSVVFMGTPHQGSDTARMGEIAANMFKVMGGPTNSKLVKTLKKDCESLDTISMLFRNSLPNLKIVSCYEMEVMPPFTTPVSQSRAPDI
jgi:hypothetical protein